MQYGAEYQIIKRTDCDCPCKRPVQPLKITSGLIAHGPVTAGYQINKLKCSFTCHRAVTASTLHAAADS